MLHLSLEGSTCCANALGTKPKRGQSARQNMAELHAGLYLVNLGHTQSCLGQYLIKLQVTSCCKFARYCDCRLCRLLPQDTAQIALAGVRVRRDRQNYASCILPGVVGPYPYCPNSFSTADATTPE